MPYHYNTPEDQAEMLASIGASSIDDLFAPIKRWTGRYVVAYTDGKPSDIFFIGVTGD